MEPPAAVAEFGDGKGFRFDCVTQNLQAVQDAVAAAVGIKKERRYLPCDSAWWRIWTQVETGLLRRGCDSIQAVREAYEGGLEPCEDDIHFDYFHFCAAMYLKAALDDKGRPTAWLGRSAYPPMLSQNQVRNGGLGSMGWTDVPFDIPNFNAEEWSGGGGMSASVGYSLCRAVNILSRIRGSFVCG